jgi:FkbM family methyltransferase
MAQYGRILKRALLTIMPSPLRNKVMESSPAFRKSAPEGMEFVFDKYLDDVKVNISTRYLCERLMWSGQFEMPLMGFLKNNAKSGWICIDVGANVGAVSLALAKHIGPEGKVYSFEPGKPNLERLRANLELNPELKKRIEIHPVGVSNEPGELKWHEEPGNPGNAMLSKEGSHSVPVITLEDFAREHNLERVDFMKVDVEGMEFEVLTGAREMLKNLHPTLYFETLKRFSGEHGGQNFKLIETMLIDECKYDLFKLDLQGNLHPVKDGDWGDYTVAVYKQTS